MARPCSILLAAAWAALVVAAPPAGAMTVRPASLDEVRAAADLAIHAHVVESRPEAVPGQPHATRTRHRLVVWEILGAPRTPTALALAASYEAPTVDVVLPGGKRDGLTTAVPGVPRLAPGDEVILLLASTPWGWQPVGYGQGTWFVAPDGTTRHALPGSITRPEGAAPPPPGLPTLLDRLRGAGP